MREGFTTVTVETALDAKYVFPDMPREMLWALFGVGVWPGGETLVLVNASYAVLTIPARIVRSITYDEVKIHGPAGMHELRQGR